MNVFFEGALLLIAAILALLVWFAYTLDEGDLLPPGWWVMPCGLIGMLLIAGVVV